MLRLIVSCFFLACIVVLFLTTGGAYSQGGSDPTGPDLQQMLPKVTQLPGFRDYFFKESAPGRVSASAKRNDSLILHVLISTYPSDDQARQRCRTATNSQIGRMPSGCPTKRRIGQEVWQSKYMNGGPPRGTFKLVARDGRSVVIVDLMFLIEKVESGEPVHRVFSSSDLRMAEDLVIGCLDRLTGLGYTSRSARVTKKKTR